jgi:predicted nucleic acid-binding protein
MNADFLDSNVILYLFDDVDDRKRAIAHDIVERSIRDRTGIISFQVVHEVLNVLTRKLGVASGDAQRVLDDVLVPLWEIGPSRTLYQEALRIHDRYRYGFFDAQIVAAAIGRGCERILTEDLQDGQSVGGVEIVDPFRAATPAG